MTERDFRSISNDAEENRNIVEVKPNKNSERIRIKSDGEGDCSIRKQLDLTEDLDKKLYGNNRQELDTLRRIQHELNLSEISECELDSENITLSRVREITEREISKFQYLADSISIKSSTRDEESVGCMDFNIRQRAVHLLPKFFRKTRHKHTPKILDLKLLSSINSSPITTTHKDLTDDEDCDGTVASSLDSGKLSTRNYNFQCTSLTVPLVCKNHPDNFPAITKITTKMLQLDELPSFHSSSFDGFSCIYDGGYGDVILETPKDEDEDDKISYKELFCRSSSDVQNVIPVPSVPDALILRATQSTDLSFYDVDSSASSQVNELNLLSDSEEENVMEKETGNSCFRWFCFNFLLLRKRN